MKKNLVFFLIALTCLLDPGCIVIESPFKGLPPGKWIGVLQLDKEISGMPRVEKEDINPNVSFEMVNAGELPFEFEVHYANEDSFYIHLINATDTFVISDIKYGTDRSKAKDTFEIHFPMYNTLLKGYFEENVMEGEWLVLDKENYRIPFVARYGKQNKFTDLKKAPAADISGVWKVNMGVDTDKSSVMVASFEQSGNTITGTFSAPSGDYRFLSGTVQGNKVYLSQFDGATAYLIEAKMEADGSLSGLFRSGKHYQTLWTAVRDESFVLEIPAHSAELTGKTVSFTYKNESGASVSLEDPAFQGKPKVLQIMGSWCHNCYDEGRFFTSLPARYKDSIAFLGLAVERTSSEESAFRRIRSFRKQTGVEYPLLLVSTTTQKEEVLKAMPFLDKLEAYPTTVFLNERNEIVEVRSGFFGPASHLHEPWRQDFFSSLDKLLKDE